MQVIERIHRAHSAGLITEAERDILETIHDPCTPDWLRTVLQTALDRDPIDAANALEYAAKLFRARAAELMGR